MDIYAEFPELIDNTMRAAYRKCPQSFFRAHMEHLATMIPSIHLHAGGAFAAGLEGARRSYYDNGLSISESLRDGLQKLMKFYGPIEAPVTKTGDKSLGNVIKAFDSYFQQYPLDKDPCRAMKLANGKHMIEFNFSIPTECRHPTTGNPILYGGRSDMIGEMNNALWVTDEKTASQLGEQWSNNWILDSQFTGYIKAAKDYGYPVAGALIRGIGLLKTKISHSEAMVYRSDWEIDRWWSELHEDIENMKRDWERQRFSFALTKDACNSYGGCPFVMLCSSPRPDELIPIHYRIHKWNPLAKDMGADLLDSPEVLRQLTGPELDIPELLGGKK